MLTAAVFIIRHSPLFPILVWWSIPTVFYGQEPSINQQFVTTFPLIATFVFLLLQMLHAFDFSVRAFIASDISIPSANTPPL